MIGLILALLVILAAIGIIVITLKVLFFWLKIKLIIAIILFTLVAIPALVTSIQILFTLLLL